MKIHIWYSNQFGLMITWGMHFERRKYITIDLPFITVQVLGKRSEKLNGRIFSSDDEKICDCIYPIIRDIYPQEYCGDCGKKIP